MAASTLALKCCITKLITWRFSTCVSSFLMLKHTGTRANKGVPRAGQGWDGFIVALCVCIHSLHCERVCNFTHLCARFLLTGGGGFISPRLSRDRHCLSSPATLSLCDSSSRHREDRDRCVGGPRPGMSRLTATAEADQAN